MNAIAALFALRHPDGFHIGGYVVRLPRDFGRIDYAYDPHTRTATYTFEPPALIDPDRFGLRDRNDLADGYLLRVAFTQGESKATAYVERDIAVVGKSVQAVEFEVPS